MKHIWVGLVSLGAISCATAYAGDIVIFIPGHDVEAKQYDAKALKKLFAPHGYEFRIMRNEGTGDIQQRTLVLQNEFQKEVLDGLKKDQAVHIVAHSMGGLQARWMLHFNPHFAKRVSSLTTIGTPHRGAKILEAANPGHVLEAVYELFGKDTSAYDNMKPKHMIEFNQVVKDAPGVRYFSMAFALPQPYELYTSEYSLVTAARILQLAGHSRNDGLVSEDSQIWGERLNVTRVHEGKTQVINTCDHRTQTRKAIGSGVKILGLKLPGVPSRNPCDYKVVFGAVIRNLKALSGS
jgi:pimeloyl-ACP methyl ester carboxylesterase